MSKNAPTPNWPSKTGNPSGPNRTNNPPKTPPKPATAPPVKKK